MKNGFIIFKDSRPESDHETLSIIKHFCHERSLRYRQPSKADNTVVRIEGKLYHVDIREAKEEPGNPYWMICCVD